MIRVIDLDNCRELWGIKVKLESDWIKTDDGYSYAIDGAIKDFFCERDNFDNLTVVLPDAERKEVIAWVEEQIAHDPLLEDLRQEVDERHGIEHEGDGIPTLHELNR